MEIPSATYRIQLHQQFTFKDLEGIVDYLEALGISTIYAAPIVQSVSGSLHGYDVVDPHTVNPEIGSLEQMTKLSAVLKSRRMNWLQDIVPNHMALASANKRLYDVLERGIHSEYYNYFDVDWNHPLPVLRGKLMVPFLGDNISSCLLRKEIKLAFSELGFTIDYFDAHYPLSIPAYKFIQTLFPDERFLRFIDTATAMKFMAWSTFKADWIESFKRTGQSILNSILSSINTDSEKLQRVLDVQYYRLTFWKDTEKVIDYRRFFTVNSLICLRMEDKAVFQEYHKLLFQLYRDNIIQGFRIDHIDGLYDPEHYLLEFRKQMGDDCYVIAEKILGSNEEISRQWPLQGTSGYEFLSFANQLFTDKKGSKLLLQFYRGLVPEVPSYKSLMHEKKKLILEEHMAGEWDNVTQYFFDLGLQREFDKERIKSALGLIMIFLPVYRLYLNSLPVRGEELRLLNETIEKAKAYQIKYSAELSYLHSLLTDPPANESHRNKIITFFRRLMQFTGPLTAKGVEDTTFYIYNPLISHDEVGEAPLTLSMSVQEFHAKMINRQMLTPLTLNATSTHDTKRGEDLRLRLNVLSEMPDEWIMHVTQWFNVNKSFYSVVDGIRAPDINDEYFMYQTILGGFPDNFIVTDDFITRVQEYIVKALREAKVNSNWQTPNVEYENACLQFIKAILLPGGNFLNDAIPFVKEVCRYANTYSLSQTLLKITAPGIPDIYQGCELWDLSYVDPDNRRPVDYLARTTYLQEIIEKEKQGPAALFEFLHVYRDVGLEKLYVIWKALNFRKMNNDLFTQGDYQPVQILSKDAVAIAYIRCLHNKCILVVIPLSLVKKDKDQAEWYNINLVFSQQAPNHWVNIFTKEEYSNNEMNFKNIFKTFPIAMFVSSP